MEELDLGARGANYGWPNCRRDEQQSGRIRTPSTPIRTDAGPRTRAASPAASSITATQFPSAYEGSYFFADYAQNRIKRLTFDANGNVNGVFNFEPPTALPMGLPATSCI